MHSGEVRVALERKAHEIREFLRQADPIDPDYDNPLNREAKHDAMQRTVHRAMMSCIEPARNHLSKLQTEAPKFSLMTLAGLRQRRKEHADRITQGRSALEEAVRTYGAESPAYKDVIETNTAIIDANFSQADTVRMQRASLAHYESVLEKVGDIPAMSSMHLAPDQEISGALMAHAMQWRERVLKKALLDAMARAFHGHSTPLHTAPEDGEVFLLRSHALYSDMYLAALSQMREHPDSRNNPAIADRQVRQMVLEALGTGNDPMDALVSGIMEIKAFRQVEESRNTQTHDVADENCESIPEIPSKTMFSP